MNIHDIRNRALAMGLAYQRERNPRMQNARVCLAVWTSCSARIGARISRMEAQHAHGKLRSAETWNLRLP